MAYQPGIPTGSVPLNQDYLNIQGNFTSLNTQFNVDHVPLTDTSGTPPNGYHTFVHLVPFSTTVTNPPNNQPVVAPAATVGYGQVFGATINDGINTDSALYYLSSGNRLTQLTRNIQPVTTANGYTSLPGGLILQWGTDTKSTGQSTTFPIPFTAAVLIVILTPTAPTATVNGMLSVANKLAASFQIGNATGLAQSYTYNWIAIGI